MQVHVLVHVIASMDTVKLTVCVPSIPAVTIRNATKTNSF